MVQGRWQKRLSASLHPDPHTCRPPENVGQQPAHDWHFVHTHRRDMQMQYKGEELLPGSIIEDAQHGHNPIGGAIGPSDIGAHSSYVVNGQPDPACALGDCSALL